jgi:hypothetical protein
MKTFKPDLLDFMNAAVIVTSLGLIGSLILQSSYA